MQEISNYRGVQAAGARRSLYSRRVGAAALAMLALTLLLAGCSGTTSTSVTTAPPPTVTSISISPTNASALVGTTTQFTATASYSDGSSKNVTTSSTWSTSDSTVATVVAGLATAVAPGNVNVTAAFSGFTFVTILNITSNSSNLSSFTISQVKPTIAPGATLQMSGYAAYSDGSAQWVTSTTHWTSSNTGVASVQDQGQSVPGLVTAGSSAGTTTITATFSGITQSTTITVAANAVPIDLMDMTASQNYLHFTGGLYGTGTDVVPASHDTAGKAAAAAITPRDTNGNASSSGKVVFLGIGMSNATEEFSAFAGSAASNSSVNHKTLAIEDGALGAATACFWTVATGETITACPDAKGVLLENQYDRVRDSVLAPAGLSEQQVQVLWIKNANPRPGPNGERTLCDATVSGCVNDLGTEAILYEQQLGETIRAAKSRYPNLQEVFLSTRIYAGYATNGLNPEPYAYEYGYSAKWLIAAQVSQENGGGVDPVAGDMSISNGTAPWTAWGAYLWANGTTARSDGLQWLSSDFQGDGTHPDGAGTTKVVNLLTTFYLASPYTPWFRP